MLVTALPFKLAYRDVAPLVREKVEAVRKRIPEYDD
jgi:hypothetical protein